MNAGWAYLWQKCFAASEIVVEHLTVIFFKRQSVAKNKTVFLFCMLHNTWHIRQSLSKLIIKATNISEGKNMQICLTQCIMYYKSSWYLLLATISYIQHLYLEMDFYSDINCGVKNIKCRFPGNIFCTKSYQTQLFQLTYVSFQYKWCKATTNTV